MLGTVDFNKIQGAFDSTIDLLGTLIEWRQSTTNEALTMRSGMRTVGKGDTELINAYGLDTRIFTTKMADWGGVVPNELDLVYVNATGNWYTLNAVHEIWINDTLVGYKMMAKANR